MGKLKINIEIESYGIYTKWDRNSKTLPEIKKFTNEIPAIPDTEFGYILHIKKGKSQTIEFEIKHPDIRDKNNKPMAPFTGEIFISSNDFRFYIGDCIWTPVENKTGVWEITTFLNKKEIVKKTFSISLPISQ